MRKNKKFTHLLSVMLILTVVFTCIPVASGSIEANAATKEIVIADADSTVLFQGKPILVTVETPTETPTGTQGGGSTTPTGTSGGTTGGNTSGGTTSGGTTSGGTTGKIADGSAVKTTGAGVDTSAVAGASAVAVLAAAAGAVYAVKSRKERA